MDLLALWQYGIFPDQGSNPCPLHWQGDLNHWTIEEVLLVFYASDYSSAS